MAELYRGLPVIRVKDWRAVTPDFLARERRRLFANPVDVRKLYLPYWIHEFTAGLAVVGD